MLRRRELDDVIPVVRAYGIYGAELPFAERADIARAGNARGIEQAQNGVRIGRKLRFADHV
ncbi:hypothetical protein SDC9_116753 [bioreactor metagenome]|uniref:Uncharacterized protein n=1 Tax=bioreactor metagenome TaxID=1076179 RepID=A0A645BX29_9ZZZZ